MVDVSEWKMKKIIEMNELQNNISILDFSRIENLGNDVVRILKNDKKIAFLGNGGSAAESMHIAAEFVSKCSKDHRPLNVICLNESQSAITAIANDYGFQYVFQRIVAAELKKGDMLIALSTSGKSTNVLNAINTALEIGVEVKLWTGSSNVEIESVDIWSCSIDSTPRVQEIHLIWGHLLAEYVELFFE